MSFGDYSATPPGSAVLAHIRGLRPRAKVCDHSMVGSFVGRAVSSQQGWMVLDLNPKPKHKDFGESIRIEILNHPVTYLQLNSEFL